MALSSLGHERYFQQQREKRLPSLAPYFRRQDGVADWQHKTPHLYSTQGLLNLREAPVSGEAFRYWLTAFVQQVDGEVREQDLQFMAPREQYYPLDDDQLVSIALPLSTADPVMLGRQLARFRKVLDNEGVFGLRELSRSLQSGIGVAAREVAASALVRGEAAEGRSGSYVGDWDDAARDVFASASDDRSPLAAVRPGSGRAADGHFQWVNAYVALQLSDALRRRYRFIKNQRVDIIDDCARLAAFDSYYMAKPEMQVDFSGDIFVRIGQDLRNMSSGVRRLDWSWLKQAQAHVQLPLGRVFRETRAVADLVLNDALVEIKPVRTVMVPGAADQILTYSLMYQYHHPEHELRELRFYLARHATWVVASLDEIRRSFPVREFAEMLWATTENFVARAQQVDFERFCHRQAHVAGMNAWRMEDQIHSAQRRYERAGRIGVTRIAAQREVPHAVPDTIRREEDAELPDRLQRAAEALALERLWRDRYEQWHNDLREDYAVMQAMRDPWREFVEAL